MLGPVGSWLVDHHKLALVDTIAAVALVDKMAAVVLVDMTLA
jgi:hypothetical protein